MYVKLIKFAFHVLTEPDWNVVLGLHTHIGQQSQIICILGSPPFHETRQCL